MKILRSEHIGQNEGRGTWPAPDGTGTFALIKRETRRHRAAAGGRTVAINFMVTGA